MPINVHQNGTLFHLTNQKISYLIQVLSDGSLGNLYFGKKVTDREDFQHLIENEYRPNTSYVNKGEVDFSVSIFGRSILYMGRRTIVIQHFRFYKKMAVELLP